MFGNSLRDSGVWGYGTVALAPFYAVFRGLTFDEVMGFFMSRSFPYF
jgi:hypothetical protein